VWEFVGAFDRTHIMTALCCYLPLL
jgi:hypothetical protein